QVLERTGKIDILSMDACLMQMMEVAYEARSGADYIVASEETEPGDGYTYNTWLDKLTASPSMEAAALSKVMVNSYADHYQSINQGATQSAVKTSELGSLAGMVDGWVSAVMASGDTAAARNARTKAQAFYYSSNKDLYHFVKLVDDASSDPAVKAKGGEILSFLSGSVITHNRAVGSKYANAFGLAVYLPNAYNSAYDGLQWAQDSKWDDFMKWIK
nr:clostripain-related cysteine peptidase [Elusimicrobiota bacterium]